MAIGGVVRQRAGMPAHRYGRHGDPEPAGHPGVVTGLLWRLLVRVGETRSLSRTLLRPVTRLTYVRQPTLIIGPIGPARCPRSSRQRIYDDRPARVPSPGTRIRGAWIP